VRQLFGPNLGFFWGYNPIFGGSLLGVLGKGGEAPLPKKKLSMFSSSKVYAQNKKNRLYT